MIPVLRGAKINIHAMRPGLVPGWLSTLNAQGANFPVVKAVDDLDWLIDVSNTYPNVTTIGRLTSQYEGCQGVGEPNANLEQMATQLIGVIADKIAGKPALKAAVKFWEVCNEPDPPGTIGYSRLAELMKLCMVKAQALGIKLGIFAVNNGTPEWREMVAMVATGVFEVAKQGGHIMTVHEGVFGDDPIDKWWGGTIPDAPNVPGAGALCFRYRFLYSLLVPLDQVVPLVVTEFYAGGPYSNGQSVLSRIGWYDEKAKEDWYHLGVCPFTVSPTAGWGGQNYEPAYPTLIDYMVQIKNRQNAAPDTVPPTPEPPPSDTNMVVIESPVGTGNLRREPSIVAQLVGNAPNGTEFELVEQLPDWYGIKVYVSKTVARLVDDAPIPPTPGLFRATAWPTPTLRTTQWFAANPQNYAQFGLPGHDGQDGRALTGEPIYAMAGGTVYLAGSSQDSPNYGVQVRIDHGNGHKTVYAHLQAVRVTVGQTVTAGQLIGTADSTGNSTSSHWHGTYKRDGLTYTDPAGNVWPRNLHDPWLVLEPLYLEYLSRAGIAGFLWANSTIEHPHFGWGFGITNLNLRQEGWTDSPILGLVQAGVPFRITGPKTAGGYYPAVALLGDRVPGTPPVPEPGNIYDLLDYMRGDGRQYELQYTWGGGGTHPCQTRRNGNIFYNVKGGGEYEECYADDKYIYRGIDTSESPERFYTQNTGNVYGAMWAKRRMAIGETVTKSPLVIHFWKANCQERLRGQPTDRLTLVRHYDSFRFDSGITLSDVLYLEWNQGEGYLYAKNYGLVGFSFSGGKSYISEIHQGRPDLERREIPCFRPGSRYYMP